MKTGIMGAMKEEVDSILEQMSNVKITTVGTREYYLGLLNGHEVILTFSRWGKVASASSVTTLINLFNIKTLFFIGAAGAIDPSLHIGDIVVSRKLYQHDMDARPIFKKGEIPLTGKTFFRADDALASAALKATNQFASKITQEIDNSLLTEFSISNPKCIEGTIARGDMFVDNDLKAKCILKEFPQASAVEMEGAAAAQVCDENKIPFVVIRIISDLANHSACIDFQRFISEVANKYSAKIVKNLFDKPTEEIKTASKRHACM